MIQKQHKQKKRPNNLLKTKKLFTDLDEAESRAAGADWVTAVAPAKVKAGDTEEDLAVNNCQN